jgi:hypothetical protein
MHSNKKICTIEHQKYTAMQSVGLSPFNVQKEGMAEQLASPTRDQEVAGLSLAFARKL